jgi:hypothetical protein
MSLTYTQVSRPDEVELYTKNEEVVNCVIVGRNRLLFLRPLYCLSDTPFHAQEKTEL